MRHANEMLADAAVAVVACLPIGASAETQCKAPAGGIGLDESAAIASWRSWVSSNIGAPWANYDLAQNKFWSETNLGLVKMLQVSANPCRNVIRPGNIGVSPLQTLKRSP